jgi:lipopolysaccharide biosynthesis regulator YciM
MKVSYKLVFSDPNLQTKNLLDDEFKKFQEDYPQIADLLLNPEKLTKDVSLLEKVQLDNWQTTANLIMGNLWKFKGANIFHLPVNPQKLGES